MFKKVSMFLTTFALVLGLVAVNTNAATAIADVRDTEGNYIGRTFSSDFDKMFDDFSRSTLSDVSGTGLWWAYNQDAAEPTDVDLTDRDGYLETVYSATIGNAKDSPIFKIAGPANTDAAYPFLVFVMNGLNGAQLADLTLSFRLDDNHNDIDVPFTQLLDPDLATLEAFNGEFQVFIIDIASTLDGKTYTAKSGFTDVPAGGAMVGFHLVSTGGSGVVQIKEIYYSKTSTTLGYVADADHSLLDNFNRSTIDAAGEGVYWRGANPNAFIVGSWLAFDYRSKAASYRSGGWDAGNNASAYENFVISIKGQLGGEDILVSPYYRREVSGVMSDVWGTPVLLSELKGPDNELLPAVSKDVQNLVINFTNSGLDKDVLGFKFTNVAASTGLVYIDDIFFTNMEYDAAAIETTYPLLDASDIVIFDSFNRDTLGATAAYDGANPVALNNGLSYIIAYAGMDKMSIQNGSLVLDATNIAGGYMQYTSASNHVNDGSYEYAVFKIKGDSTASLNNFRIDVINASDARQGVVWGNGGLKSGTGLVAPQLTDDYPFVTNDGYMYYIIDLEASNLGTTVNGFDLFYGGDGKLFIDSIFFANRALAEVDETSGFVFDDFNREAVAGTYWWTDTNAVMDSNALKFDATADAYAYFRGANPVNNFDQKLPYLVISMKGTTDLSTLRISDQDGVNWVFANSGALVGPTGAPITEQTLTTSYQDYVIDLEKSGLAYALGISIAFGGWGSGIFHIDQISYRNHQNVIPQLEAALVPVVTSIVISAEPTKLVYEIGDTFESAGLVVEAVYSDYTKSVLAVVDYAVSQPNMAVAGPALITVTHGEFSDNFSITINEAEEPVIPEPEDPQGLTGVQITGIVLGSTLIVGVLGYVGFIFLKKRP